MVFLKEILFWQTRTIEMMYRQVGDALRTYGNNSHPTDYLLFLCPGKRELAGEHIQRLEPATEQFAKTFRESMRYLAILYGGVKNLKNNF